MISRFGFNLLVLVWLVPIIILDIYGNTVNTGWRSELYYIATIIYGLLALYAIYQLTRKTTLVTQEKAIAKIADPEDAVISFSNLAAVEYIYCAILCLAAFIAWGLHHDMNVNSTGIMSVLTLFWSLVDLVVVLIAGYRLWRLKSGTIVQIAKTISNKLVDK